MPLRNVRRQVMMAMVGATLATSLAVSGCSNGTTDSASKSTSVDASKLLMNPAEIDLPGQTFTAAKPPQGTPEVSSVSFVNGDQSLAISEWITISPDLATAKQAAEAERAKLATVLPGTTMSNVSVGQGGAMGVAPFKNGTKLANTIAFQEGTVVVTTELDSPVNSPFPQGFPVAVAQQQDAVVKSGMSG